ncbi:MAG: hypothetical protein HAW66_01720, partial [Shewanella sp.]|nr:hypothetical protein [Shewanella sp.]
SSSSKPFGLAAKFSNLFGLSSAAPANRQRFVSPSDKHYDAKSTESQSADFHQTSRVSTAGGATTLNVKVQEQQIIKSHIPIKSHSEAIKLLSFIKSKGQRSHQYRTALIAFNKLVDSKSYLCHSCPNFGFHSNQHAEFTCQIFFYMSSKESLLITEITMKGVDIIGFITQSSDLLAKKNKIFNGENLSISSWDDISIDSHHSGRITTPSQHSSLASLTCNSSTSEQREPFASQGHFGSQMGRKSVSQMSLLDSVNMSRAASARSSIRSQQWSESQNSLVTSSGVTFSSMESENITLYLTTALPAFTPENTLEIYPAQGCEYSNAQRRELNYAHRDVAEKLAMEHAYKQGYSECKTCILTNYFTQCFSIWYDQPAYNIAQLTMFAHHAGDFGINIEIEETQINDNNGVFKATIYIGGYTFIQTQPYTSQDKKQAARLIEIAPYLENMIFEHYQHLHEQGLITFEEEMGLHLDGENLTKRNETDSLIMAATDQVEIMMRLFTRDEKASLCIAADLIGLIGLTEDDLLRSFFKCITRRGDTLTCDFEFGDQTLRLRLTQDGKTADKLLVQCRDEHEIVVPAKMIKNEAAIIKPPKEPLVALPEFELLLPILPQSARDALENKLTLLPLIPTSTELAQSTLTLQMSLQLKEDATVIQCLNGLLEQLADKDLLKPNSRLWRRVITIRLTADLIHQGGKERLVQHFLSAASVLFGKTSAKEKHIAAVALLSLSEEVNALIEVNFLFNATRNKLKQKKPTIDDKTVLTLLNSKAGSLPVSETLIEDLINEAVEELKQEKTKQKQFFQIKGAIQTAVPVNFITPQRSEKVISRVNYSVTINGQSFCEDFELDNAPLSQLHASNLYSTSTLFQEQRRKEFFTEEQLTHHFGKTSNG